MQLRRYRRDLPYSYGFGFFPTLELLRHRPRTLRRVFYDPHLAPARLARLVEACRSVGVRPEADAPQLSRLRHKETVQVLAVFDKYDERLDERCDHLLLFSPDHYGNVGTILRTMAGLGFHDLAAVEPCVDTFNPHVVRASLGARFAVRTETFPSLAAYRERFGHRFYLLRQHEGQDLGRVSFASPFTLVLGPEWPGLPPEALALGQAVHIPQTALIESFNLAVAAAIALYEASRGRAPGGSSGSRADGGRGNRIE